MRQHSETTLPKTVDQQQATSADDESINRLIVDNAMVGIVLIDSDWQWIRVNKALCTMLGYTEAELRACEFTSITYPDDLALDYEHLNRLVCGEIGSYSLEKRYVRKDASTFWVRVHVAGVYDDAQCLTHFVGQVLDIDAERVALAQKDALQEEARLHSERLTNVIEGTNAGTWEWNVVTGELVINEQWAGIIGYSCEELEPTNLQTWERLIHPKDLIPAIELLDKHFAGDRDAYDIEARMHHKDGHWIWVHNRGKVVEWLEDGRPFRMAGTHMDITQRKQHEVDLLEANEELTKSNVELEQFAYVASHDLQEPLRMVSSFTQLLERNYGGELDDKAHEYMHFAVDGAPRMQQLIKDLLAYSRLGRASIERTELDMEQVTARVLQSLQLSISDAGAKIISGALPVVHGDPGQLQQLLQNLIANAIKYRSEKPVEIAIGVEPRNHEQMFFVRDNGIGIDPRDVDRIFEIFQRLHGRTDYVGTGIGLSICKRIVERHGGRIWVESKIGEGSTFFFTLNCDPVVKSERNQQDLSDGQRSVA